MRTTEENVADMKAEFEKFAKENLAILPPSLPAEMARYIYQAGYIDGSKMVLKRLEDPINSLTEALK